MLVGECTPASFASQTGSLPNSLANVTALQTYNSLLDFRLNYMCCCGVGPLRHDPYWNNVRCGPLRPLAGPSWPIDSPPRVYLATLCLPASLIHA